MGIVVQTPWPISEWLLRMVMVSSGAMRSQAVTWVAAAAASASGTPRVIIARRVRLRVKPRTRPPAVAPTN
jgi:hypothetical protein